MTNVKAKGKAKAANVRYTEEQTAALITDYQAAADDEGRAEVVANWAAKMSYTPRSIISKLSREKVYIKPEAKAKNGQPRLTKDDLEERIIAAVEATGRNGQKFVGISKASKAAGFEILSMAEEIAELRAEMDARAIGTGEVATG